MSGYRVGQIHPAATAETPQSGRRQWHELDDGEVADLADALVYALARELVRLEVAGAEQSDTWTLAEHIRDTIRRSHEAAFQRHLAQQLEKQQ